MKNCDCEEKIEALRKAAEVIYAEYFALRPDPTTDAFAEVEDAMKIIRSGSPAAVRAAQFSALKKEILEKTTVIGSCADCGTKIEIPPYVRAAWCGNCTVSKA